MPSTRAAAAGSSFSASWDRSYEVVRSGLNSYRGFGLLAGWQEEEIDEALE
jgi:hypothetical protein